MAISALAERRDGIAFSEALLRESLDLGGKIDQRLGWYCDFRSPTETFVVFSERVFRYPRGDTVGRSEAEAHARSVGVPESQLDWPE